MMMRALLVAVGLAGFAAPVAAQNENPGQLVALFQEACISTRADEAALSTLAETNGWRRQPLSRPDGSPSPGAGFVAPAGQVMLTPAAATGLGDTCVVLGAGEDFSGLHSDLEGIAASLGMTGPFTPPPSSGNETSGWASADGSSLSITINHDRRSILLTFAAAPSR